MIIEAIAKHFGVLVLKMVKTYTLLGMEIELLDYNKLEIGIKSYIQEAIYFFNNYVSTKISYSVNKNRQK